MKKLVYPIIYVIARVGLNMVIGPRVFDRLRLRIDDIQRAVLIQNLFIGVLSLAITLYLLVILLPFYRKYPLLIAIPAIGILSGISPSFYYLLSIGSSNLFLMVMASGMVVMVGMGILVLWILQVL